MGLRRNALLGAFLSLVVIGGLLLAVSLSATATGRVVLVVLVGALLTIGMVAGGFVWWVRREVGSEGPCEAAQERLERRMDDEDD
jgi:hypothetical protein